MSEQTSTPNPPVVTLFESYGAGAAELGALLATELNVPFHAQAFSSEDLESAQHGAEPPPGPLTRVLGSMGSSHAFAAAAGPGAGGRTVAAAQQDAYDLVMDNTRTVLGYAAGGGVILGRNGAFILGDHPGAVHVRLDAPVKTRIERAAAAAGIPPARAADRQRYEDHIRVEMSRTLYGWDPSLDESYDLVLNTGRLSLDTCVRIILAAIDAQGTPDQEV